MQPDTLDQDQTAPITSAGRFLLTETNAAWSRYEREPSKETAIGFIKQLRAEHEIFSRNTLKLAAENAKLREQIESLTPWRTGARLGLALLVVERALRWLFGG